MPSIDWKWRAKACAIHLIGSALVAALAAALVFLLWYPWPFSTLAGGIGLFVLITGVDVVIGPLITFAIFDRRKGWPELRRDLAVVVMLQLAALGYGMYVMHAARPVVLALEKSRLRVVSANDVVADELPQAPASLQGLSLNGPVILRTVVPTDPDEQYDAIAKALAGTDLGARPKYWRPWDDVARQEAKSAARPLAEVRQRNEARAAELDGYIQRSGRSEAALGYLPILSRHAEWIALIDIESGEIVGFAPFNAH